MEQKERYTRAEPRQSDREEQSKPVSLIQERSEIVEQLKLLNYNLLNIGLILGGTLGAITCNMNPLDIGTIEFAKVTCGNLVKMKEVNAKMGITEEEEGNEEY